MEKIENLSNPKHCEFNKNDEFILGTEVSTYIPETGVKVKFKNKKNVYFSVLSSDKVFGQEVLNLVSSSNQSKRNSTECPKTKGKLIPKSLTYVENTAEDLVTFTRECFKDIGGVELELPPRGKMRKTPNFS